MSSFAARYRLLARHRAWLPFAVSGILTTAMWLYLPSIYSPYVRVASSKLEFELLCMPDNVRIEIASPYARPTQAQLTVMASSSRSVVKTIPLRIVQDPVSERIFAVDLPTSPGDVQATANLLASLQTTAAFQYTLLFARTPNLDVQQLKLGASLSGTGSCVKSEYRANALLQLLTGAPKSLMRYRLMQEDLSDLILLFNGSVANLCLVGMVLALLWFGYLLVSGARQLYFSSDKALRAAFDKRMLSMAQELTAQGPEAVLRAQFSLQYRNLSFAKTMGPAFGFLLTVSSLSAALHPSVQVEQDTFRFVSGIQIAMVATFVGLAIRIAAQFGQRVYQDLAERLLAILRRP